MAATINYCINSDGEAADTARFFAQLLGNLAIKWRLPFQSARDFHNVPDLHTVSTGRAGSTICARAADKTVSERHTWGRRDLARQQERKRKMYSGERGVWMLS